VAASKDAEGKARDLEDSVISAFADIIEHRNVSTFGSSRRSAAIVRILSDELIKRGDFPNVLDGRTADLMFRAAPLHDVGKICISDFILLKPSHLSDDEFSIMKTHAALGAEILKKMFVGTRRAEDFHDYAVTMALSHHERWDGKGYPDGLSGEAIPLCARIMAAADVFDALLDSRSYKQPMSFKDAALVITSGKGTAFDPRVVEAFQAAESRLASEAGGPPEK
jgi:putative two-component system response regulator